GNVAPGALRADANLRDRIADDLGREPGVDHDAVGDLAGELQGLRSGGGEIDRDALAVPPGELARRALVDGFAGRQQFAHRAHVVAHLREGRWPQADVVDGTVAGADAQHGAAGRQLLQSRGRAGGDCRMTRERIDHARAEADRFRLRGDQRLAHIDVAVERLRIRDPGDVEAGVLGGFDPVEQLARAMGQKVDAEADGRGGVGHVRAIAWTRYRRSSLIARALQQIFNRISLCLRWT